MKGLQCQIARRWLSRPPSHFNDPKALPETFNKVNYDNPSTTINYGDSSTNGNGSNFNIFAELSKLIVIGGLTYIAIDNYINRIKLEKVAVETAAINLKTLQVQQTNFINARNKRNLQIIQERKQVAKRDFKMAVHIALLRKQLLDNGVEPINIEEAIKQFEAEVKIDNSIANISGQTLWLQDDSLLKQYLPDTHDYDKQEDL